MHRFPIHLTFDGDTGDDDPDDQPYWDKLDFFTIVIISASGRIPDIIRSDKITFGGNDSHEYDLEAHSLHDKIPWSHHDVF